MATRGKPSVFSAFNQLRVSEDFDSDDGSAEERHQERKEKQKQKKKFAQQKEEQLKDLAFVSVSKPKKTKNKKNKSATNVQPQSPTGSTGEEVPATNSGREAKEEATEPMRSLAAMIRATSQPQKTATVCNGVEKKPQSADQQQQQKKLIPGTSPPKQQQPQQKPQQQTAAPPQAPVVAPAASVVQSSSETELGAVYAPSHITITRVDGQMKRTVAVTEVMDQLLRYTQQNAQLLMVQEQLGHANRNLQDQLQSSAEIINGLQNEVTMFRQMCLNLQAEVSLLRSSTTVSTAPDAGSNPQPQHHRPPPGMS